MGARYEDPVVARFVQRDPIGPGYSYASNNPISFWAPTGTTAVLHTAEEGRRSQAWTNLLMVVALTLAAPVTEGTSLMLLAGLVAGLIFVAATHVLTNGKASAVEYIEAFTTAFIVGTVAYSVYASFRVAGTAVSGAGKASLYESEIGGAATARGGGAGERAALTEARAA